MVIHLFVQSGFSGYITKVCRCVVDFSTGRELILMNDSMTKLCVCRLQRKWTNTPIIILLFSLKRKHLNCSANTACGTRIFLIAASVSVLTVSYDSRYAVIYRSVVLCNLSANENTFIQISNVQVSTQLITF